MISQCLTHLSQHKVKIVICLLCLTQQGLSPCQLLSFVKPIPFSVDYLAEAQLDGQAVIYDAMSPKIISTPTNIQPGDV